jgi:hypothetical protein
MIYGQVWYLWARYQSLSCHYIDKSSMLDLSSQLTAVVCYPRPRTSYNMYVIILMYSQINNRKNILSKICTWARYQCSSGNNIGNSNILDLSSQLTEPPAVSHPRPRTCYNLYALILIYSWIHIIKRFCQRFVYGPNISAVMAIT